MIRTVIIVLGSVLVSALQTNQPVELPQGEGKEIIEGSCSGCHGLTEVAKSAGFTEVEWRKVLQAMVERGAQLNDTSSSEPRRITWPTILVKVARSLIRSAQPATPSTK